MAAQSPDPHGPAVFSMAGIRKGFLVAQPLGFAALLSGIVFGVMASEVGLGLLDGLLMSGFIYSATGQMVALESLKSAAMLLPLAMAIFIINARYLIYSAAVQPWLAACATRPQTLATLLLLGDSTWALSMREYRAGYRDAGFMLGSGLAQFVPWLAGTFTGQLFGNFLTDPASLGLDFMLTAFAGALLVGGWRGPRDFLPLVAASICAWALYRWLPGTGWYIVGGGIASGALAACRRDD